MPIKPKGKSNIACKDCGFVLSNAQAILLKVKLGKKICPKCKSQNLSCIFY
jgi:predicted Zn-ribbon and HTH transcriptional regulator